MAKHPERGGGLRLRAMGDRQTMTLLLQPGENKLGSGATNELVIALRGVSRAHAVLTCEKDAVRVRDLGSKNGTFVNRRRIDEWVARVGDTLVFGPAVFLLERCDAGDATIALAVEPAREAPQRVPAAERTPTARDELVPATWLEAVAGAARAADTEQARDQLERLRGLAGAAAATWMTLDTDGELVVLAAAGATDEAMLAAARHALAVRSGQEGCPGESYTAPCTHPALVVRIGWAADGLRALAVFQPEVPRQHAGSLLQVFASLLARSEPRAQEPLPRLETRLGTDLLFRPGSVRCASAPMRQLYEQLATLAASDVPILICGESGVGKEHVANLIHDSSARKDGPFVAINCTAIPGELLEAELFGIEAGVATGVTGRAGNLTLAMGGTVLLDEIADMTPALQAKLLRVVEASEIFPVGARRPIPLDVRFLSATNADLASRRAEGRFRGDLYHRLAGFAVTVPPLRERRQDIPVLVQHFADVFSNKYENPVRGVTQAALELLMAGLWDGNVRELERTVERLVLACAPKQPITADLVRAACPGLSAAGEATDLDDELTLARHVALLEKRLIASALERSNGQIAPAARLLGISRQTLRVKARNYGQIPGVPAEK